jgi:type IV secretory pathway TraG/TraD family ATPase VirD4
LWSTIHIPLFSQSAVFTDIWRLFRANQIDGSLKRFLLPAGGIFAFGSGKPSHSGKAIKLYEYATTVVGRQISLWVAIQSIKQLDAIYGPANAEVLLDNMDTQLFYRQRRATAKYLEEELGRKSEYSRSQSTREGGNATQGISEQGVPLMTANEIKQMDDWDVIVFHHNLPPFRARRMNWLEHSVLRERQAKQPPILSPLPPLIPITLRSPLSPVDDDDELINPDDFE